MVVSGRHDLISGIRYVFHLVFCFHPWLCGVARFGIMYVLFFVNLYPR